jgi:CRP/FNR family cyclic AMP-dependent transcriptional regulator
VKTGFFVRAVPPILAPAGGVQSAGRHDVQIQALAEAVQTLNAGDALQLELPPGQWQVLQQYLVRHEIRAGDLLIRQGDHDRTMYLLETGNLQVFVNQGTPGTQRLAILRPGSVAGEVGLFGDLPRMANVEAMTNCVVWALRMPRFEELAARVPLLALQLVRACAGTLAARVRANIERHEALV